MVTTEDKKRTEYYHQEQLRLNEKISYISSQAFIDSLDLKVDFALLTKQYFARASELTFRTNQFNNNKKNWSELEIEKFVSTSDNYAFTVSVRDKFGSYGVVALILATVISNQLHIEQWCMSCRVFDRDIENNTLKELGIFAKNIGAKKISILFKNKNANKKFIGFILKLQQIKNVSTKKNILYITPATITKTDFNKLTQHSDTAKRIENVDNAINQIKKPINLEKIAFYSSLEIDALANLIHGDLESKTLPENADINNTHKVLHKLWEDLLQKKCASEDISFFDMGGKSIELAQLSNKINQTWKINIPIYALYKNNTINQMASYIISQRVQDEGK